MKGLPPLPKPLPVKRPSLPDGTVIVLVSVFVACAGIPYVVKDLYGDQWARGAVGITPLVWLIAAFFVIKPHWRKLTKKAQDDLYIRMLLGFVGQLAGVVVYVWLV